LPFGFLADSVTGQRTSNLIRRVWGMALCGGKSERRGW